MAGYWNLPEETAKVFFPGGWLRTGDLGRLSAAGYLFVEDRIKDVIVVSGFKVYPNEIEDIVTRHPGVREAAAIGVDDPQSGEAVKLFVVRKDADAHRGRRDRSLPRESDRLQSSAHGGFRR